MSHQVKQVIKKESVDVYTCDWCGDEISHGISHPVPCCVCGRHACHDHRAAWHCEDACFDNPDWHCAECWNRGEVFRMEIWDHEEAIRRQLNKWHQNARDAARGASK